MSLTIGSGVARAQLCGVAQDPPVLSVRLPRIVRYLCSLVFEPLDCYLCAQSVQNRQAPPFGNLPPTHSTRPSDREEYDQMVVTLPLIQTR